MPNTRRRQYEAPETRGSKRKATETNLDAKGSPEPKTPKTDIKALYEQIDRERNSRIDEGAKRRLGWAEESLAQRPNPEDWRDVIFSTHFDLYYTTQGADGIYTSATGPLNTKKMDRKRLRCWSAFGYNFKCPLVWYEMLEKCSAKQVQQVYIEKVLEPHVKKLLDEGYSFVLEEPDDGKDDPLKSWMEKFDAERFIVCPGVPGESPIEKAWRVPDEYLDSQFWDLEMLQGVAAESWKEVSQDKVNEWVESIPERLEHVKEQKGQRPARETL